MSVEQTYRRLPGRSGLFIRHSLWMGPDHLLRVRAHPFAQEYRRYYFKDIQALVLTEAPNPAVYFLYTVAALFALLCVLLISSQHPVWGTLCAPPTILLFYLGWRIPECACRIQTRVSADRLPSLGKIRSAIKTMALVKSRIEQTQGKLHSDAVQSSSSPSAAAPGIPATPPELRRSSGMTHWILFALVLLRCILILVALGFAIKSVAAGLAGDAVGAAVLLTAVVAALQQPRGGIARGVQWIVYGTLIWQALSFAMALGFGGYLTLQIALMRYGAVTNLQSATRLYQLVDASAYLSLALAGIILLWRHQRSVHTPPPLAPDPISGTPDEP